MRVCCVGAGAVGGTLAARLSAAGARPFVVDADPAHVEALKDPGIVLEGDGRTAPIALDAGTPEEADHGARGPYDLVLLAVRSGSTEAALRPVVPHLADSGDVVSVQNGLNEERIAALVGEARTIGAVVGFGATWLAPGRVEVTSSGGLVIGRLDGGHDARLTAVRDLLDSAAPTDTTDNIRGALWGKMLVNAVTVLGAVGGMLTGDVLARGPRRRVVEQVVAEGVAVALAEGVELREVLGVPTAPIVARTPGWQEELGAVLDVVAEHFAEVKSVTLRDLELGRPTEVDAVTGEIVARARARGVPSPVNTAVLAMLREVERGARPRRPENLDELSWTAQA